MQYLANIYSTSSQVSIASCTIATKLQEHSNIVSFTHLIFSKLHCTYYFYNIIWIIICSKACEILLGDFTIVHEDLYRAFVVIKLNIGRT